MSAPSITAPPDPLVSIAARVAALEKFIGVQQRMAARLLKQQQIQETKQSHHSQPHFPTLAEDLTDVASKWRNQEKGEIVDLYERSMFLRVVCDLS